MKKLYEHTLSFDPSWKYVQDNLDKTNTLSCELLNLLNFMNGRFFTLLPNDANLERLYEFEAGLILKQNPEQEYWISGRKAAFSTIPTIRNELSRLLSKKINSNPELCCIFDDVVRCPTDPHMEFFHEHGLSYENEVYYLLNENNISSERIVQCLNESNSFWHSLCILTAVNLKEEKKLTLKKIKDICLGVRLVMIGAYDAEGYVFWEPTHQPCCP